MITSPLQQNTQQPIAERKRTHGLVVECDGTHAVVSAIVNPGRDDQQNHWNVGQLVSIAAIDGARIVGQCYKVDTPQNHWDLGCDNNVLVHLELLGEIQETSDGAHRFSGGISSYPKLGSVAHRIRSSDLEVIYRNDAEHSVAVGHLTQESSIPAKINIDSLLSRHFAAIGSTGVGKSSAVSLLIRKIIQIRQDVRVLLLDPHNEFTSAFRDEAIVRDGSNLFLPFWLFRFDEFAEVIFRGQKKPTEENELLRDLVAQAREMCASPSGSAIVRKNRQSGGITADSPVPFRVPDLLKLIDERLGELGKKGEKPHLSALADRITSISQDPRFSFMFSNSVPGGDQMEPILRDIFRVPLGDKPVTIIEMSGLPSEVMSSVVAVMCRLAFDLALSSQGSIQTLVVCEEAHRYVPANSDAAFAPARRAISRIAREGRKYGAYLGIVSQRPSEIDPTILSQCNTVFAMRLANHADQSIIGRALTNGAQSTIGFLASIANQECIAFGEALRTPMRMTFETVDANRLPGASIYENQSAARSGKDISLTEVIDRMRGGLRPAKTEATPAFSGAQPALRQPGDPDYKPVNKGPTELPRQARQPTVPVLDDSGALSPIQNVDTNGMRALDRLSASELQEERRRPQRHATGSFLDP